MLVNLAAAQNFVNQGLDIISDHCGDQLDLFIKEADIWKVIRPNMAELTKMYKLFGVTPVGRAGMQIKSGKSDEGGGLLT